MPVTFTYAGRVRKPWASTTIDFLGSNNVIYNDFSDQAAASCRTMRRTSTTWTPAGLPPATNAPSFLLPPSRAGSGESGRTSRTLSGSSRSGSGAVYPPNSCCFGLVDQRSEKSCISAGRCFARIQYDAPGADNTSNRSRNGEWFALKNYAKPRPAGPKGATHSRGGGNWAWTG